MCLFLLIGAALNDDPMTAPRQMTNNKSKIKNKK
jgi:hypothetical protein